MARRGLQGAPAELDGEGARGRGVPRLGLQGRDGGVVARPVPRPVRGRDLPEELGRARLVGGRLAGRLGLGQDRPARRPCAGAGSRRAPEPGVGSAVSSASPLSFTYATDPTTTMRPRTSHVGRIATLPAPPTPGGDHHLSGRNQDHSTIGCRTRNRREAWPHPARCATGRGYGVGATARRRRRTHAPHARGRAPTEGRRARILLSPVHRWARLRRVQACKPPRRAEAGSRSAARGNPVSVLSAQGLWPVPTRLAPDHSSTRIHAAVTARRDRGRESADPEAGQSPARTVQPSFSRSSRMRPRILSAFLVSSVPAGRPGARTGRRGCGAPRGCRSPS